MNNRQQFIAGLRAGVPIVLGYIPSSIAYAVVARQAGLTAGETLRMSLLVYAGASQMMAAGMIAQGASVLAVLVATFVLNLRHVIMSACVFNRTQPASTPLKLLAAFGVTDECFAAYTTGREEKGSLWLFLGMAIAAYASWAAGSLLGALMMDLLPPLVTASLGISLYAMFIALLTPNLRGNGRLAALVGLTAVCNTLLGLLVPASWALIASALGCALLGAFFVEPEEGGHG